MERTNKVVQVGNLQPDGKRFKNRQMGRVYHASGISPCLCASHVGDNAPKYIVVCPKAK